MISVKASKLSFNILYNNKKKKKIAMIITVYEKTLKIIRRYWKRYILFFLPKLIANIINNYSLVKIHIF